MTPRAAPRWSGGVRREVLPNGLTLLVQPVPGSPAAAVVTRVRAGFFDEPDRWTGISHVLEHMFFKGTPTRGVGEIARETKAAGGYLNAATSYDYTTYYTVLPARSLAAGLDIQSDALRHAALDEGELAREIQVIIEEAKRKLDSPGAVAQETLHAELYDHHRIRRWRIGTPEGLAQLTRDDLVAYYRSRYVPSRVIVSIAGGIDPEEALVLARERYGDWAGEDGGVDQSPEEPPRRERRARTLRGDVRQAEMRIGWRSVPALHPDEIPLDLAATVLASGRASRLYRAAREPGLVTSIGAWSFAPTEVGVFSVAAELDAERLPATLRAIAAEVASLADAGPAPRELDRARTLLRARWARHFELAEGRASELAAAESLADPGLLDREYQRLLAVTPDEVRDAVRRHLDPRGVAGVVYVPDGVAAELTLEGLADAFDRPARATAPPGLAETPVPPPSRPASGRTTAAVLHVALPGADLLIRHRAGTPTVRLGLYRTRVEPETAEQAGLGVLAVRSAVRGAGGLDSGALAAAFERLGGSITTAAGAESIGYGTTVLSEHLAEAATLLDLVLRQPTFAPADVERERDLLAEDAARVEDDMFRYPIQLAYAAAFGDRGYGLPTLGWPASVRRLDADAVVRWHRALLGRGRTTVVAVGDLDPARAAEVLAGCVADHPAGERLEPGLVREDGAPAGSGTRVAERDKAQTALAMLFPGPTRLADDRHAAHVWSAVAGGLGGRLFEALRDRRSLAYTVAAVPWQRRAVGGLLTYIATSPGREDEARSAMLEDLARFREEGVTDVEVQRAVSYLVGQEEVGRQSAAALAAEILDAWVHGTGLEELVDPAAPYRAVTPEDVRRLATRYLLPEGRVEGIVRGAERAGSSSSPR